MLCYNKQSYHFNYEEFELHSSLEQYLEILQTKRRAPATLKSFVKI